MFSPLDKYIDSMRDQYAKAGSKTIQFKDFEMLTHYGERNHGAIFFSIEAIGQTTKIIEYFEDLGDIEEEERSLTFSSDYDSFVMRWTKKSKLIQERILKTSELGEPDTLRAARKSEFSSQKKPDYSRLGPCK